MRAYLEILIKNKNEINKHLRLREAMAGLKLPSSITYPTARISTCCANVLERLDAIGYGDFKTENAKHTIKLLLECIRSPALKSAMEERLKVKQDWRRMFVCS